MFEHFPKTLRVPDWAAKWPKKAQDAIEAAANDDPTPEQLARDLRDRMAQPDPETFYALEVGELPGEDALLSELLRVHVTGGDSRTVLDRLVQTVIDNRTQGALPCP